MSKRPDVHRIGLIALGLEGTRRKGALKKAEEQEEDYADSNSRLAFIAGHTEGGAPFGVTWEEWDKEP